MKDESFYINFGSMTLAMTAEKILKSKGVESTVGKSKNTTSAGCSWGVYTKNTPRETVLNILRSSGIMGGV